MNENILGTIALQRLALAEKRLEKQNDSCPYCGKRWYFDTEIASHEPRYYATCETCCLNFFFTEDELKNETNI